MNHDDLQAEPVAWGMRHKSTGLILDAISPEEHAKNEGGYTEPLYAADAIATLVAERDAAVARCESLSIALTDVSSALEYHEEQTRPIHSTTNALFVARAALKKKP